MSKGTAYRKNGMIYLLIRIVEEMGSDKELYLVLEAAHHHTPYYSASALVESWSSTFSKNAKKSIKKDCRKLKLLLEELLKDDKDV